MSFKLTVNKMIYTARSISAAFIDHGTPIFDESSLRIRYIYENKKYQIIAESDISVCQKYGCIGFYLQLQSYQEKSCNCRSQF